MVNSKAVVAELVGTFTLVFFIVMSIITFVVVLRNDSPTGALVGIAMVHGVALMSLVYAIGPISGCHLNPAVTLALAAIKKIKPADAVAYIIVQLIGATIASFLAAFILPQGSAVNFGLTLPSANIGNSLVIALLVETVLTFFLMISIMGGAVSGKAPPGASGLTIGFTLAGAIFIGAPLSGASLNPARTFGPALVSGIFDAHIIYVIGPIIGALIAAFLYKYAMMQKEG
ncbi:MAG: aquaporin [Thaumarchaeota archaeon]|nr:aquaporin [Nitrososphaerota archaeon]